MGRWTWSQVSVRRSPAHSSSYSRRLQSLIARTQLSSPNPQLACVVPAPVPVKYAWSSVAVVPLYYGIFYIM